ncbi:MAG: polysaccharide export protein [Xanthomonadales bacterium]|nr:polysaccharide export protein [Xanthomonadales bacterium]
MRLLLSALFLCASSGLFAQSPKAEISDSSYTLGSGDSVTISVFNQQDLSGNYALDGDGRFSMPLIGMIDANGLTPAELEQVLINKLKPDYLVNPRIYVQVMNYRPYYLMGEVRGTGAFPYVAGMTYLTAIAKAGGFSYRAKQDHVYVIRVDDPEQKEIKLDIDEKVQPGDIIRVDERMF